MGDSFATFIVTSSDAPLAREIAAAFGPGGAGMWTTQLSPDGAEPVTHYISTGYMPAGFVGLAPSTTWEWSIDSGAWVVQSHYPGDAAAVYDYASQANISCTLEDIEGLFARSDCSAQEPFVALDRMGLTIVNPPMRTGDG